jgi:uncharacterized protein YfaS (alpha-2-macroglobulin family)
MPGETVKGSVEGRYFFGKPVSEGDVKISFSTFDVQVTKLGEISGKTDKNGLYSFEYKLPDYFAGQPLDDGKAPLDMEITLTDGAKHQEISHKSLPVVKSPLQITVVPEKTQLFPGVENFIYILASNPDGSPVKCKLKFTGRFSGNDPLIEEFETDDMGFFELPVTPPEKDGQSMSYTISASDEKGNKAEVNGTLKTVNKTDAILLRTDKALYRVGESMKLDVISDKTDGTVYLDIVRDKQTILTKSMNIKNGKGSLIWDLGPDASGSLTLHSYRITSLGQIIRDTRKVLVSPVNELNIEVSMNKKTYLPGENSKITFKVMDKKGKPVISVLGVDIVDESLFALSDRKPGFEKLYFLLEEELMKPKYEIHGVSFSDIVTRFEKGENKDEQSMSKVILKNAPQDDPFTLNKDSYVEKLKNLYTTFNTVYSSVYSYYYNHSYKYPEDLKELVKEKLLKSEQLLDPWGNSVYIKCENNYPLLYSMGPDGQRGNDDINSKTLYNTIYSYIPYNDPFWGQTMFLDGDADALRGAVNEEKMGLVLPTTASNAQPPPSPPGNTGKTGTGEPPARVREYFPETLYTNPELLTDNFGVASIEVPMADSITTWRLTSFASSRNGQMGNKQSPITVFQDFFVDIDLPVFLTQGDEISIPVAVYNYLPKKQTVEIELVNEDWFKLMDKSVKKLDLEKDQVSVIYFRIKAMNVGLKPLTVYAKGSQMSDAIKRKIQIEPDGKMFLTTESDRLSQSISRKVSIPKEAISGASKILVNIYPGLFSQVVEGLDKIFRMPGGCFEQTSSTTYPNVLVLDYLKRANKITPELEMKAEAYINNGYQRLLTFEVKGGGFSWFGDPPGNKLLTAFGLMEFKDMSNVHEVDPALITRTQDWLAKQQQKDGSWVPDASYLHAESWARLQNSNLLVTAYITWVLLDTKYENKQVMDKAVAYIKEHYTQAEDPYMLSVVANALASYNPSDPVYAKVIDKIMSLKTEEKGSIYWSSKLETVTYSTGISSTIETTAMITYALLKSEKLPDVVNKCITFLIQNKDGYGTWHSTQPTILTLRALLLASEKSQESTNAAGSILINGKKFKDFNITPDNFDIYQQFDLGEYTLEGDNQIEIKFEGKGNCLYQVVSRYYIPWSMIKDVKEKDALSIKVSYDKTKLVQNDLVTCSALVTNNTGGDVKMAIIDLGVPPGFSIETDGLEKLVKNKSIKKYSLTGRQVIIYIDEIKKDKTVEISYQLRAKYPLKVSSTRSQVYEYYEPEKVNSAEPVEMVVE